MYMSANDAQGPKSMPISRSESRSRGNRGKMAMGINPVPYTPKSEKVTNNMPRVLEGEAVREAREPRTGTHRVVPHPWMHDVQCD